MVECLKKAVRIAKQCMEKSVQVQLYVELINTFALFCEKGNEEVSEQVLSMSIWCSLFNFFFNSIKARVDVRFYSS